VAAKHVDVLIIGAGLSGVGVAVHLRKACPDRELVLLEGREAIGGTWDLFRYPGIRSDSDMYTFGYSFRPWKSGDSFADGPSIRRYVRETAEEISDPKVKAMTRGAHKDEDKSLLTRLKKFLRIERQGPEA